jgi:hypothetical protein
MDCIVPVYVASGPQMAGSSVLSDHGDEVMGWAKSAKLLSCSWPMKATDGVAAA